MGESFDGQEKEEKLSSGGEAPSCKVTLDGYWGGTKSEETNIERYLTPAKTMPATSFSLKRAPSETIEKMA